MNEAVLVSCVFTQVAEDDVNLGMDTRSGLAAPEPKLSRTVDPLWRVDSTKEAAPRMLRQLGPADLEGTHQWKARPQSEQERIDVSWATVSPRLEGWARGSD